MTQTLSALEQVKAAVNPYAGRVVFARLAGKTVEEITPEEDLVMRWHGLYRHRPQEAGLFMLRLKLPGGAITAEQVAAVADIAAQIGQETLSLTTRQDLELHGLTLAHLPMVFAAFDAVGLTTLGACGDQVRNVVACPVAGIDPHEWLDTTPTAQALTAAFLGNPDFANLPRKFKIALSGCAQHCVPGTINDLGLMAAPNAAGTWGYAVLVGGGLSSQPTLAADLQAWVAPEDVVALVSAVVSIFRDHGNREQRGKARVKHLLAAHGLPWFRQELEARLGRSLPPFTFTPSVATPHDHLGVHAQREAGRVYLGLPVTVGRVSVAQLRHLAAVAATHGQGRLRFTHQQNIILPDLPEASIAEIQHGLAARGFTLSPSSWQGRLVVCTGKDHCNKSVAHTKEVARRLAETLDAALPGAPFSLHISGCPNGCSQHAIADIGLQGCLVKTDAGSAECFDLWVGGGAAPTPAFAHRIARHLPPDTLAAVIVDLWTGYQAAAEAGETFSAYLRKGEG